MKVAIPLGGGGGGSQNLGGSSMIYYQGQSKVSCYSMTQPPRVSGSVPGAGLNKTCWINSYLHEAKVPQIQ